MKTFERLVDVDRWGATNAVGSFGFKLNSGERGELIIHDMMDFFEGNAPALYEIKQCVRLVSGWTSIPVSYPK